jgi:hypothetical protein
VAQFLALAKSLLKRIGGIPRQRLQWKLIRSSAQGGGGHLCGNVVINIQPPIVRVVEHSAGGGGEGAPAGHSSNP